MAGTVSAAVTVVLSSIGAGSERIRRSNHRRRTCQSARERVEPELPFVLNIERDNDRRPGIIVDF